MRTIPLTQGYVALVDDTDYESLAQYRWYPHKTETGGLYARTGGYPPYIYMHRLILNILERVDLDVDHRDRNGLNNQRENLRVTDRTENNLNKGLRSDSTTGYRGVTYNKRRRKYRARLYMYHTLMLDSYHDTPEEASAAYEAARKKLLP